MEKLWWEIPEHLEVKDNRLFIGGIDTVEVAKTHGTPTYVYNLNRILFKYDSIDGLFKKYADREYQIYYAAKALTHPQILGPLAERGAGFDVVSPYEGKFAIESGANPDNILYTGTSVSDNDLNTALDDGIRRINIDSFSQLDSLNKICDERGIDKKSLKISIRWNNSEIGAGHHAGTITTGEESHGMPIKFGIEKKRVLDNYKKALEYGFLPVGLHQHIGSGWGGEEAVSNFLETVDRTLGMAEQITDALGYNLEFIDFGGGPGIPYKPGDEVFPLEKYVKGICDKVREFGLDFGKIIIEPGRYIVGDSGLLLTEVNMVEQKHGNWIVGLDAGFNTLVRPAMYAEHRVEDGKEVTEECYHEVINCNNVVGSGKKVEVTGAGNLCETGDVLFIKRLMSLPEKGQILAFHNGGAYGFSMASRYNSRPLPAEVLVVNGKDFLITERGTYGDLKRKQVWQNKQQ